MFQELIAQMAREVEKLTFELNVTLPAEIRKAVELGDLKENSEYKAALERQQFVQARLGQLTQSHQARQHRHRADSGRQGRTGLTRRGAGRADAGAREL